MRDKNDKPVSKSEFFELRSVKQGSGDSRSSVDTVENNDILLCFIFTQSELAKI